MCSSVSSGPAGLEVRDERNVITRTNADSPLLPQAVADAVGACGPYGGFILSTVGGRVYPPDEREREVLERNTKALIEAWRELRYVNGRSRVPEVGDSGEVVKEGEE